MNRPAAERAPHGVLVVDKPRGMTSHDVVARVRRALGTRRVGHAGTLDPMATGVLVVLVGEATKLAPWLTAHDKRYRARVELGVGTDSFDADGTETGRAPLPPTLARALAALATASVVELAPLHEALVAEAARAEQEPPRVSAIHVDGRRAHERARAGEAFELEPRAVEVRALRIVGGGLRDAGADVPAPAGPRPHAAAPADGWLDVELHVAKGYYVRAFARDLGTRLGVPAHLSQLRRTASGPFGDGEAADLGAELSAHLLSVAAAARRGLTAVELTEQGAARAAQGKPLDAGDFTSAPPDAPAAWISHHGALVAVGSGDGVRWTVLRGFTPTAG